MRLPFWLFFAALVGGCAASREEVSGQLESAYVGKNVDVMVAQFGPPASTFKMNSGETAYVWQLSSVTDIDTDRGSGTAKTRFCKVNIVSSPSGIITKLTTEDANRGAFGIHGSVCSQHLGIKRTT